MDEYLDDDFDGDGTDLVKRLRSQLKEKDKELKGLREQNQKLVTSTRDRVVKDVLKDKGIKDRLAKHVLRDLADETDVTPEAVEKWLEENAEDFGISLEATTADDDTSGSSSEDVAALAAMNSVQNGAKVPVGNADLLARLNDPNISIEDLNKLTGLNVQFG